MNQFKKQKLSSVTLALVAALCGFAPAVLAQEEPTGTLYLFPAEASVSPFVGGLSDDGHNAGGNYSTATGNAPLTWNVDAGLVPLEAISVSGGSVSALSADGSIAGGRLNARAYRWVKDGDSDFLQNEAGAPFLGEVFAVSGDGLVLAGTRNDGEGNNVPFTWTEADGIASLPVPEGYVATEVRSISQDGSVIVGSVANPSAERVGIIWSNGTAELVAVENEQFVSVVDILPEGNLALVSTSFSTENPSFVLDIESGDRFPLAIGDQPRAFMFVEDEEEEFAIIVGNRRTGSNPQFEYPVYAWQMDDNGVIIDEINLEEDLIEEFDLDPETTSFEEVYAVAEGKGIFTGRITIENVSYACIFDEDTSLGVVQLAINEGNGQGARFAALIEESTVVEDWVVDAWLGAFWAGLYASEQWVYHNPLAWLYVPELPDSTQGFWLYSNDLSQWIYTQENTYPWIYLSDSGTWQLVP